MIIALLGVGCAGHTPLASVSWQSSLVARPQDSTTFRPTEIDAATPSEPGTLYERASEQPLRAEVHRGVLACRVSVTGDLHGIDAYPDRIVEIRIGERSSRFLKPNSRQWDFSVGLVDLPLGQPVVILVVEDLLGENRVVLKGERSFTGGPLGWTDRTFGVRTSVRCRLPTTKELERELRARLRRLKRGEEGARRGVAAITGWSDPRLMAP